MIPERKPKYPTESSNQQLQEKEQSETAPQVNLPVWGFQPSKCGSVLLIGYLMGGNEPS